MLHSKYFEVMKFFLKDYSKEIYGRELVGKISLSQKAISLVLNELEEANILRSKPKGNIKYYSLNSFNPLIQEYISLFEKEKKIEFLEKYSKFIDLFNELDFDCVVLFGSYANGSNTKDSDLDVLIIGKASSSELSKIGERYQVELHPFIFSKSAFSKAIKERSIFINEVLGNHLIFKGSNLFIREVLNG